VLFRIKLNGETVKPDDESDALVISDVRSKKLPVEIHRSESKTLLHPEKKSFSISVEKDSGIKIECFDHKTQQHSSL
jgi:hypothetical protein